MREALKSRDDFYVDLCCKLLSDLQHTYPKLSDSLQRDVQTVKSRTRAEGLEFLTKTLPKLGKAIDRSLETGSLVVPMEFRCHGTRNYPVFLKDMFSGAYDDDGILVNWDPVCLQKTRQILFLLYKLELAYSPDQERSVIQNFIDTESEVARFAGPWDDHTWFLAREVVAEVLEGFDPRDITPRHGPGAVATSERGDEKWTFKRLYNSIHQKYPYYEYFIVGWDAELSDRTEWYFSLIRLASGCAKVCLVPKDSRGPRLISCEPLEYQWIQQGLGRGLVRHLEAAKLTKGNINFEKQSVNQKLSLSSSLDRKYATLDLKDASDRVSLQLVEHLFPKRVYECLLASRSDRTLLPNGIELSLTKHAPMGSSLCFPVMAFVCWVISVCAIATHSASDYRRFAHDVFVYGDDIIVPTEYVDVVIRALEMSGLLVNRDKSFHSGEFRESCGVDAFRGVDVTPTRVHTLWSGKASDGNALMSYVAYANGLETRGLHQTASFLWRAIRDVYGKIPYGTSKSAFPCREVGSWTKALILNLESGFRVRAVEDTGAIQVFTKYCRSRTGLTAVDSWERLLKNMVQEESDSPDEVVLSGYSTQIKTGWRRL